MSNFVEKLRNNVDSYFSVKTSARYEEVERLAKDEHYKTGGYSLYEEKRLMEYLHGHKMVEIGREVAAHERMFYAANFVGLVLGAACCMLPYLVKEFHAVSSGRKNLVKCGLFFGTYAAVLCPFYLLRRADYQLLIAQNVHKIRDKQLLALEKKKE